MMPDTMMIFDPVSNVPKIMESVVVMKVRKTHV
jgi:hypothetical protein